MTLRLPSLPSFLRPARLWAIVRRDFLISASYRGTFVLDALFGMIGLLVYYYISQVLRPEPGEELGGAPSYFAFAAVGVTVTAVVQAASASLARRIREEQLTGTLEALVTQPLSSSEIAGGFAAFPFVFASARACVYLLAAAAWLGLDLGRTDWGGFLALILLTGLSLSSLGIALGALTLTFKKAEAFVSLLTLGLGLGGGAFFPVSALPPWAEPVAERLPTRWVFDGIREALFLGGGWGSEARALVLFSVIFLPLSLLAFSAALARARARGTLGEY